MCIPRMVKMTRKPIIFINFFMHTMDPINIEYSHPIIHRIINLFIDSGVPADIYLQNSLAETIVHSDVDPELAGKLREVYESGWAMATLRDSARPKPEDIYSGLSWEDAYSEAGRYQSQYRDIITGELDPSRVGGADVFKENFGRYPDIISRESVAEAYYMRERGAFVTLGLYPDDFVSSWVKPPMAWFMGMLAVHLYPGRVNMKEIIAWQPDPDEFDAELKEFIAQLPDADYHFVYLGGHNVDMYADNRRWNALNRGANRHIESWAFCEKNPKSLDEARIPEDFFYPCEKIEELFDRRRSTLENFRRNADKDRNLRIVNFGELRDAMYYEPKFRVSREDVVAMAKFLEDNIRRGVPEYVDVGGRYFSLAESYQALAYSLDGYHKNGELPDAVEVDWMLLGPTEIPLEWKPHGVRRVANPPAVGVHTLGKWGHPPLNAAEMLLGMSRAALMISGGKKWAVKLRYVSMYPEAMHFSTNPWLDDMHMQMLYPGHQLTALQLWTLKPAVLRDDCE